ncbi:ribbon-helix-helix domain-containing protein [Methylorubrum sp. POS3]|uniref:ribbon-helix-helix domain-containing protein n=1 Tax=Methylorubrum sp. POS3 TaxID=2998492 RepID=UPI00372AE7B4
MSAAPQPGIVKRSVSIAGHRTSISLETEFWEALQTLARSRGQSVQALVGAVDAAREGRNLSSAIRVFILEACQTTTTGRMD